MTRHHGERPAAARAVITRLKRDDAWHAPRTTGSLPDAVRDGESRPVRTRHIDLPGSQFQRGRGLGHVGDAHNQSPLTEERVEYVLGGGSIAQDG
jgi:hypothetical protein